MLSALPARLVTNYAQTYIRMDCEGVAPFSPRSRWQLSPGTCWILAHTLKWPFTPCCVSGDLHKRKKTIKKQHVFAQTHSSKIWSIIKLIVCDYVIQLHFENGQNAFLSTTIHEIEWLKLLNEKNNEIMCRKCVQIEYFITYLKRNPSWSGFGSFLNSHDAN